MLLAFLGFFMPFFEKCTRGSAAVARIDNVVVYQSANFKSRVIRRTYAHEHMGLGFLECFVKRSTSVRLILVLGVQNCHIHSLVMAFHTRPLSSLLRSMSEEFSVC